MFDDFYGNLSDFISETVNDLVTVKIDLPDASITITVDDDKNDPYETWEW